jgi:hypothetical protein
VGVDHELMWREPLAGKALARRCRPANQARGRLLHVDGETLVLFFGVVIGERLRWRCSPMNKGSGRER